MTFHSLPILGLFLLFLCAPAWSLTGLEVMQKVKEANEGIVGSSSKMGMTLIDAGGNKVEREMEAKTLEDLEDGNKSIMEFLRPLDVKGTKLLTWTNKEEDNQQWLYLPQFKRVKKINSSNQSGAFMSSEFSFEDIAGQNIDDYSYKLLEEDDKTWTLESTPKKTSGYSKLVSTISKKYMGPLSVDYYDRKGELLKKSKLTGYEERSVGKKRFYLAGNIRMDNAQTRRSSIINWKERKLGVEHPKRIFRSNQLK